jgi:hypothetical protein
MSPGTDSWQAEVEDCRAGGAETLLFALIKTYLCCSSLSSDPSASHAGAGAARSQAISDRISANICRNTATAAIWTVT